MDIQNLSPEMCIHHLKKKHMHMHTHTYTHIFKREDGGWKGNQDRADSPITRIHEIMIWSILIFKCLYHTLRIIGWI